MREIPKEKKKKIGPILVFDLSRRPGRVGLIKSKSQNAKLKKDDEHKIIWYDLKKDGGRELIPTIQKLLHTYHLQLTDLTGFISFNQGPSFTGLRIAAVVANVFAWTMGKPAVGVAKFQDALTLRKLIQKTPSTGRIGVRYE